MQQCCSRSTHSISGAAQKIKRAGFITDRKVPLSKEEPTFDHGFCFFLNLKYINLYIKDVNKECQSKLFWPRFQDAERGRMQNWVWFVGLFCQNVERSNKISAIRWQLGSAIFYCTGESSPARGGNISKMIVIPYLRPTFYHAMFEIK